jgi:GNAT superfamily N-acetyltransferase
VSEGRAVAPIPGATFEQVGPDDPRAIELFRAHSRTAAEALRLPFPEPTRVSEGLDPPGGALLLASLHGEPVGIGGVRDLGGPAAELKAMYVAPAARGRGIGRGLLGRLEELAAERGCQAVRLDTLTAFEAACALYESAGYERIADYNDSPHADRWYGRRLD